MRTYYLSVQTHQIASHLTQYESQSANHNFPTLTPSLYLSSFIGYFSESCSSHTGFHALLKHSRQYHSIFSFQNPPPLRELHANMPNPFRFLLKCSFISEASSPGIQFPGSFFSIVFMNTRHTIDIYSFIHLCPSPLPRMNVNSTGALISVYNLTDV